MRIQHNIMAMNAYRNYTNNTSALSKNLEKLSSGYKINRAGDDAAGLAISEKMRAQITGLQTAQKNAKDGISLVQTAEGALTEVHDMLNRMVELATQSANGTYDNETDRAQMQKEISQLKSEIDRIADSANFNGIKLLDGSQAAEQLSKLPVEFNTVTTAAGVTVDNVTAGQGTKGTFTLDLTGLHGTGDTIAFAGKDTNNNNITKTLTFGTDFSGATLEEQAQSIVDALKVEANFAGNFEIKAEGSKITLTSNIEGTAGATITSIESTNVDGKLGQAGTGAAGAASTASGVFKGGWTAAFSTDAATTSGIHPQVGDKVVFNFEGINGEKLSATVEVTQSMLGNGSTKEVTEGIAKALQNAYLNDNADTGMDESKIRVSDLFTVDANKDANTGSASYGGIQLVAKNKGAYEAGTIELWQGGTKTATVAASVAEEASANTSAAAEKHEFTATSAQNFSAGDVFKISGKLSNGQSFELALVAGTDFDIGGSYAATITNIHTALTDADSKATVTVGGEKVAANTIFGVSGTDANKHEFKVTESMGALTIESTKLGAEGVKGLTSDITDISLSVTNEATSKFTMETAVAKQAATSTLTLDSAIKDQYGTAIKIGDTTYEIVKDARDVVSRNNVAVVIEDLANTSVANIAKKLGEAVTANDTAGKYAVTRDGNSLTITSTAVGSDVPAIDVSTPYGDKVTTASFQFDPKAVSEGSILNFNGNTYEFVAKGGEVTNKGAIAIEVADFENATSKSLGDAFADVAKNGVVSVADDGTVTLRSAAAADGTISKPTISFKEGLRLQIGDTAESFNQLNVQIEDMHTKSLGIDDLDISTQDGADVAIDKIKAAINHVSSVRGTLGATQNRLDHTINNLSVMTENIQDAESAIRDTDVAEEMMAYTKNNILVQSAQAMLAQANQVPQGVLQLLG